MIDKTQDIIMVSGKRMAVKSETIVENRAVAQSLSNDKKLLQHTLYIRTFCQSDENTRFLENKKYYMLMFIAPKATRR